MGHSSVRRDFSLYQSSAIIPIIHFFLFSVYFEFFVVYSNKLTFKTFSCTRFGLDILELPHV